MLIFIQILLGNQTKTNENKYVYNGFAEESQKRHCFYNGLAQEYSANSYVYIGFAQEYDDSYVYGRFA